MITNKYYIKQVSNLLRTNEDDEIRAKILDDWLVGQARETVEQVCKDIDKLTTIWGVSTIKAKAVVVEQIILIDAYNRFPLEFAEMVASGEGIHRQIEWMELEMTK